CEDATVSLQGAVGSAGDGRGEPGLHQLHQDTAVRPFWPGSSSQGHVPAWGAMGGAAVLLWLRSAATGLRLLPPSRTTNRSLCESNSLLRSALLLSSTTDPLAKWATRVSAPPAPCCSLPGRWEHSSASLGQQQTSASSTDTTSSLSSIGSHSSGDWPHTSSHQGTKAKDLPPVQHPGLGRPTQVCSPAVPGVRPITMASGQEPALPCPMYRLVLAGDSGTGKSNFLLRLCMNEFRGDISSTLGVDFQIKQMLVDGEQTTLQIWDTAGQER
ncbi:RASEF protein, partial [Semnornis frantzii]|nr:RASEF protein [Semnornis frantzii]